MLNLFFMSIFQLSFHCLICYSTFYCNYKSLMKYHSAQILLIFRHASAITVLLMAKTDMILIAHRTIGHLISLKFLQRLVKIRECWTLLMTCYSLPITQSLNYQRERSVKSNLEKLLLTLHAPAWREFTNKLLSHQAGRHCHYRLKIPTLTLTPQNLILFLV